MIMIVPPVLTTELSDITGSVQVLHSSILRVTLFFPGFINILHGWSR